MKLLKRFESFSGNHEIPSIQELFVMILRRKIITSSEDYILFDYNNRHAVHQAGYNYENVLSDEPVCSETDIQNLGHPSLDITWVRIRIHNFAFILFFQDGEPYATAPINQRIKEGQKTYYKGEDVNLIPDTKDDYGFFILFEDIICVFPRGTVYDRRVTHINMMSDRATTTSGQVHFSKSLSFEEENGEFKFTLSNPWGNELVFKCESRSTGKIHNYRIDGSKSFNLLTNPAVSNSSWSEFDIPPLGKLYSRIMKGEIGVSDEDLENIIIGKSLDPKNYKGWSHNTIIDTKLWSGKNVKPLDDKRHFVFFEIGDTIGNVSTYDGSELGFFFGLYEDKKLKSLVYVGEYGGFLMSFGILVIVSQWTERYEFTTISLEDGKPVNHFVEYYDEDEITFQHDDVEFIFDTYGGILTSTNESGETESFDMENLSWNKMTKPT